MNPRRALIGLVSIIILLLAGCARATRAPAGRVPVASSHQDKGRLENLEDSLSDDDDDEDRTRRDDDEGDLATDLIGFFVSDIFSGILSAPFHDLGVRYGSHPYDKSLSGIQTTREDPRLVTRRFSFDARAFSHRVDADLVGYGLDSRLRLPSSFSLGFDWTHYVESSPRDSLNLWNVDFSVGLPFLESLIVDLGGGLGGLVGDGSDVGGSYGLGVQWFPWSPVHVLGNVSRLHFDAGVLNDLQINAGVLIDRVELSLGYRGLVAPAEKLGGPQVSISVWL